MVFSDKKRHGNAEPLLEELPNGSFTLTKRGHLAGLRPVEVPCGGCIGCRLKRSRAWAMRCMHEASLHDANSFLTLTYDEKHLPMRGQLHYPHFQTFMKQLRKRYKVSFYMCGEYGDDGRPHYHAIIFGHGFPDKKRIRELDSGCTIYRSAELEKLWKHGYSSIGNVTFESAGYVARYCMKKITGHLAMQHYERHDEYGPYQQIPEFAHMSLNPAIGKRWLEKWHTDVFPADYCIVDGRKVEVPTYYDKLYETIDSDQNNWIKFDRMLDAETRSADNTEARLTVRATVAKAKLAQFKRT